MIMKEIKVWKNRMFPAPKGISLPVNTIIILIIAALVLGIIAVFFTSYSGKATASISHAAAWAEGCKNAKALGCKTDYFWLTAESLVIKGYDPNGDDTVVCTDPVQSQCKDDSLASACNNFFGYSVDIITGGPPLAKLQEDCRKKCCG